MPAYISCLSSLMPEWKAHQRDFGSASCCDLCKGRSRICLYRGQIPCDFLFVGEGPGEAENLCGLPFKGPTGNLLDELIDTAITDAYTNLPADFYPKLQRHPWDAIPRPRIGFGNLIACIPWNEDKDGVRQPSAKEIKACRPRLVNLVELCRPKHVILLGLVPAKHFPRSEFVLRGEDAKKVNEKESNVKWGELFGRIDVKYTELIHPSGILRLADDPQAQQRQVKIFTLTLTKLFSDHVSANL